MSKSTPKHKKKAKVKPRKKAAPVRVTKAKKKRPRAIVSARAADRRRVLDAKNTARSVRRAAKKLGKALRGKKTPAKFKGGALEKVAKGFRAVKEAIFTTPVTIADKESRLAKIGIKPYKSKRKRTGAQKKKIEQLYADFAEFASRGAFRYREKFRIIRTANKATLSAAKKSGMAVYEHSIYVHVASSKESVRVGSFMGERIIARTYYGKLERIFLGGADVFDRVVKKLQKKKLKPGQMITGAFFGGPTFHRAIYANVAEFLNYINNSFVPHLAKGQKATKRNIARAKAALIKNIAVVQIENPEFEDDGE